MTLSIKLRNSWSPDPRPCRFTSKDIITCAFTDSKVAGHIVLTKSSYFQMIKPPSPDSIFLTYLLAPGPHTVELRLGVQDAATVLYPELV